MKYSFEKPIEQEILEYVMSMARQMEIVANNGEREIREGAHCFARAYRTVEGHILREIKLRKAIKK